MCLTGGPQYAHLIAAAFALNDWSIHAEILRYRRLDDDVNMLEVEIENLRTDLSAALKDRRASEIRLEHARAYEHFAHLEVARNFDEGRPRTSRRAIRSRHVAAQQEMAAQQDDNGQDVD